MGLNLRICLMRSIEGVLPEKISKAIGFESIGNAPAIIVKK